MKVTTTRFGEIEVDESLLLKFMLPIIGYNNLKSFVLIDHNEDSCSKWLQSAENPEIAFPVTMASYFEIDYVFNIPDESAEKIGLENADNLIVFNIATIPSNNPQGTTINLRAPVIVNTLNMQAMQIILPDESLKIRHSIFDKSSEAVAK